MNVAQRDATIDVYDRYMTNGEATKGVLNSPCVDKYNGKVLSRDNSKAVISDRFGRPKGENRKRNGDKKGNNKGQSGGNNDNAGPSNKKGKKNNNNASPSNYFLRNFILIYSLLVWSWQW